MFVPLRGGPAVIGRKTGTTLHDLRRTYCVERLRGLVAAGWSREAAVHVVSRELGHHRAEVLDWYLESLDETPEAAA